MRLERRRWVIRAFAKRRELAVTADRTGQIAPNDVLVFSTFRNEYARLPYFLEYYRAQGVAHFLMVDNGSTDDGPSFLKQQPDVSLWSSQASYRKSRFGIDWMNYLLGRYGHNHWTLVVDPDELLVYPFCDTRTLPALTDWLDACGIRSFGAMLLDMYPKGPIDDATYLPGQDPLEVANWFDAGNYTIRRNSKYWNLWVQGGPRSRVFFPDKPESAPALNKVPLVRWNRRYTYVSSTHMILPRGLNLVYDSKGGEKASGVLLHTKFMSTFAEKAQEEHKRKQHYAQGREYAAYATAGQSPDMWCKWSEKYINWRQLEVLGLMSKGNWA